MEQYLHLVLNYTASVSRNFDDENFSGEQDDNTFAVSELHYKIPFWIGVIVISLLFLSAIIASIRYCFYTLCSSHAETEKVTLVPPKSPCLTTTTNTIQRQRRQLPVNLSHHISDDNEKPVSFSDESKDHHSNISIIPIVRQHSRPNFTSTQHHHTNIDTKDINKNNFSSIQSSQSQVPVDFRKKIHGIYVLPVSPTLSSSSSTTNTDEIIKNGSNTMPIRSLRHISSSINVHNDSTCRGIKNNSFADSPQPKDRTLPRSHASTLRRIQPPAQPPPLPPTISQLHFNNVRSSININNDKSLVQHQSATIDLDHDNIIALRYNSQKIYGKFEENHLKKSLPPPVPCRSQKPTMLSIGFEGLTATTQPDSIGFRVAIESSPQDDYSEHTWPKPPESMTTSEISVPQILPPSIPYDRLHHDHLMPTVLMRHNSTTNFFQHHRFGEHTILTESET
ncbi:unnamed protein product [Rotaria sp. Silwood2]|nr:unnamed protein product [Rotaria sp. Silwood2]CAF2890684.1 unnamed protein product [Rotaria sp. Silwood2]CAF3871157.1 unnamed protein product [Rotaria sp. Silwood2]CAF4143935.1 unnamed protein product [Rotaria sp. Silwood2]